MTTRTGILRGGVIILEDGPDLPEGQRVTVTVDVAADDPPPKTSAFGSCRDRAAELDALVEQTYRDRHSDRD